MLSQLLTVSYYGTYCQKEFVRKIKYCCIFWKGKNITEAYVGLILFNETAALFMTNKVWDASQLNIDILISGSHRESDVWVVSSCQRSTPGLKFIEIILPICTMATRTTFTQICNRTNRIKIVLKYYALIDYRISDLRFQCGSGSCI